MALLLKNLLFTVLVPGTVGVWVPLWIAGDRTAASGFFLVVAAVVLACGAAIYTWCVWDFATFGRATPVPIDAPKKLVVHGLYRYSRNPMYVGVLTVILGWAILYRSTTLATYALAVALVFNLFILLYEEPHLLRIFGSEYTAYRDRVGRWLSLPSRPRQP